MFSDRCHPALCLLHLAAALAASAAFRHPCYLAVSFLGAFLSVARLWGKKGALLGLASAALGLAAGLFYASYCHFGVTPLFENFIGNRVTLESLLYGLTLGIRAAAVFLWLVFARRVLPTDKVVYLFGPGLAAAFPRPLGDRGDGSQNRRPGGKDPDGGPGDRPGPRTGRAHPPPPGGRGAVFGPPRLAMESLIGASDAMRSRGGGFGRRTGLFPLPLQRPRPLPSCGHGFFSDRYGNGRPAGPDLGPLRPPHRLQPGHTPVPRVPAGLWGAAAPARGGGYGG